mmetsp:Transcript_62450/g.162289  ORF Transcript_62450/g.162289 Transcript_62450/m.162289 type:complete len:108 (-) Transcript_62450:99-422(-)
MQWFVMRSASRMSAWSLGSNAEDGTTGFELTILRLKSMCDCAAFTFADGVLEGDDGVSCHAKLEGFPMSTEAALPQNMPQNPAAFRLGGAGAGSGGSDGVPRMAASP